MDININYYKNVLVISSIVLALQTGIEIGGLEHGDKFEIDHIVFWLIIVGASGLNVLLDFIINRYKKG